MADFTDEDGYCEDVGTDERLRRSVQELIDYGIDQKTLAEAMGISDSTLSRWLEGRSKPLRLPSLDGFHKYLRGLRAKGRLNSPPDQISVTDEAVPAYDDRTRPPALPPAADNQLSSSSGSTAHALEPGTLPSRDSVAGPQAAGVERDTQDLIDAISKAAGDILAVAGKLRLRNTGEQAPTSDDHEPPIDPERRASGGSSAKKR